jgi:hypothetical protein
MRPPDRNSDAHCQVLFDATAAPIRPPLPLPSCHPTRVATPCGSPTHLGSSSRIPAPSGYDGYDTCHHRRPATPYMDGLIGCLRPVGGGATGTRGAPRATLCQEVGAGAQATCGAPGAALSREVGARAAGTCGAPGATLSRSHGDTWLPWSCPEPGGGSQSRGDMWHPRSCPEPGGGYHSTAPSSATLTTTTTSTLATLASKGYHLHVVLSGFCSSHSICAIATLQLRGDVSSSDFTFDLFSSLTVYGAPAVTVGGC